MTGWQSKKVMKSIEDELLEKAANEVAREIDREVLWGMLKSIGWTRVTLSRFTDREHSVDIVNWLRENVDNPYEKQGCDFIFENEKDAVNFILRWYD